jgi:hypothetical protein
MTAQQDATASGKSVNRISPLFVLVIGGLIVWVPMYISLSNNAPHLTNHQKSTLLNDAGNMRTLISAIIIAYTNGDRSTEPLAHDLSDVFNRAGIEPVFGWTRPDNPDQTGIIICVRDLNNPSRETEDLKRALDSSGITYKVAGFPKRSFEINGTSEHVDRDLVIWVARKPL